MRAGIDVVEVSELQGGAPLVTGYGHAPWAADPGEGPVTVWAGRYPDGYVSPRPVQLPAPVIADATGAHHVPVAALESLGAVEWLGGGRVAVALGTGARSGAMATSTVNGLPYAAVADLVAAVDGTHAGSAEASYTYAVEWRPDLGQLCLWRDEQHPIS